MYDSFNIRRSSYIRRVGCRREHSSMVSEIKTIRYGNGDVQRVQSVTLDSWSQLCFHVPEYSPDAFRKICNLYRNFIVPKCPWIFGQLVLFSLPENYHPEFLTMFSRRYGAVADYATAAAIDLRNGLRILFGKPVFFTREAKQLWDDLKGYGCIEVVCGNLPCTTILPVGNFFGFLSNGAENFSVAVNSSFFIMDRFDCSTPYDIIGTPFGMTVEKGVVSVPPLFDREALLVKEGGNASVTVPLLSEMEIVINGRTFLSGQNAVFFSRPGVRKTGRFSGMELVIIGRRVAAVHHGGRTFVPSSGFVLRISENDESFSVSPGDRVDYCNYRDVLFGVQTGNSVVINSIKTDRFLSPFYNIRKLWSTSYPPSLYPLGFDSDRAPRTAIGEDKNGKPMIVWAEGAAKFGYHPGDCSCGATLAEMSEICAGLGMKNGVNLDGGGSSQILLNGQRSLKISDRNAEDCSEAERAVPIGIIVK